MLPAVLPEDLAGDFVPPAKGARSWKPHHWLTAERALRFRNSQLTHFKRLGRTEWGMQSGYSRRSLNESTMRRLKALTGDHLSARTPERQTVEVRLRCKVLNELAASTWSASAAA